MSKMTIMRGLPASGKSTLAEQILKDGNTVRINKDLLRTMLHFDKFNGRNEGHTQNAARKLADLFLTNGYSVVIDDTNLNPRTVQSWVDLAKTHQAKIEYSDCEIPVDECIRRDEKRHKKVGKHVIQKMALQHKDYLKGEKVVVCDLDGTLCDTSHRQHFVDKVPKDWKGFFGEMSKDTPRTEVIDMLEPYERNGAKIIFVSARPEKYREVTEAWLEKAFNGYQFWDVLIMRDDNDTRPDTEVKSDIYDKYLSKLEIIKVFDDRPSVIRMWREKGLVVEDVGKGVEF